MAVPPRTKFVHKHKHDWKINQKFGNIEMLNISGMALRNSFANTCISLVLGLMCTFRGSNFPFALNASHPN